MYDPKGSAVHLNRRMIHKILKKWNSYENTIMFRVLNINFIGHWKLKKYWQNIYSQYFLEMLYVLRYDMLKET